MSPTPKAEGQIEEKKSPKKKKAGPKLVINLFNTQYQVIEDVAKALGFRIRKTDPNLYINPY